MPTKKWIILMLAPPLLAVGLGALPAERLTPARVVKDLKAHLKLTADKKLVRVNYVGTIKNFTESEGSIPVPHRSVLTAVDVIHTACGLVARESWEVHYYQSGENWSFRRIAFTGERETTRPTKKLPILDDVTAQKIVITDMIARDPGITVRECVITEKKPSRKFCIPSYAMQIRALLRRGDGLGQTFTDYECRLRYLLRREGDAWKVIEQTCLTDGAKPRDVPCFYDANCRRAETGSILPPITTEEAMRQLRETLSAQYGLVRDEAEIVSFTLIQRSAADQNGTVIPLLAAARVIVNERVPLEENGRNTYRMARAIYDCTVSARMAYDFAARRWVPEILNCCPGDEACDNDCSTPARACRRVGER